MSMASTYRRIAASLLTGFLMLAIAGCHDHCQDPDENPDENPVTESIGVITGPDVRDCACCGGYLIEIEGMQYRFWSLPPNSPFQLPSSMEEYPIKVHLSWRFDGVQCLGDEIIVEKIERID